MTLEDEGGECEADQLSRVGRDVPRTVHPVRVVVGMVGGGEGP